MRTKNIILLLIVALISITFIGCNEINGVLDSMFLTTPDVKASDLENYSGSEAENRADIETGLNKAFGSVSGTDFFGRVLGDDYNNTMDMLKFAAPQVAMVFEPEENIPRDWNIDGEVSIIDEEFSQDGITVYVDKLFISGSLEGDKPFPNTTQVSAEIEAEIMASMTGFEPEDGVTLHEFTINSNLNGNGTAKFVPILQLKEVSAYTALATSLGFSISGEGFSGKYVISFKYVNSIELDADDIASGNFAGEEDLVITVKVFNNSGVLLLEEEYTYAEFIDFIFRQ